MRASRLVSILLLLQTRGRMSARALADELEVSPRTIYRDIESLSAAGVPVYGDRGAQGGYQLVEGYRTRLTGLTTEEAESLFLAGMPGPAAELGLGTVLAAAELKLMAALPPELRSRAGRIRERFHLDPPSWYREAENAPFLATVAEAVWNQQPLQVRYRKWTGEVERRIEPLGIVLKGGSWYTVARSEADLRTYRVARILELEVLEEGFERPHDFDLATYWRASLQRFEQDLYRAEATVRFSPRAQKMAWTLGKEAARAVRETAAPPDGDGWVQAIIPVESIEHAEYELLKLGPEVDVVAPPELRSRMTAAALGLARLYGTEA